MPPRPLWLWGFNNYCKSPFKQLFSEDGFRPLFILFPLLLWHTLKIDTWDKNKRNLWKTCVLKVSTNICHRSVFLPRMAHEIFKTKRKLYINCLRTKIERRSFSNWTSSEYKVLKTYAWKDPFIHPLSLITISHAVDRVNNIEVSRVGVLMLFTES